MINFYNIDCNEFMKDKPDGYYDLAIVDPPYGIGQGGKKQVSKSFKKDGSPIIKYDKRNGAKIVVKNKMYNDNYKDNKQPDNFYFKQLIKISKNQIIWGANHFISKIPFDSSCWIVWDKVNGKTDQSDCELAWTSFKTSVRQFEFMWNGFTQGKSISEGRINQGNKKLCEIRLHPNQKPILLYKWILKNYAKPGWKIFDSHGGSGSIAIACHEMGYDLDICELDKDYFKTMKERFDNHIKQQSLFTPDQMYK